MRLQKLSPLFVLLLAACGGGGGGDNGTPASESRVLLERVAGSMDDRSGTTATDPVRGCVDGPATDILLGWGRALAIAANGQTLYLDERGMCDGRYRIRQLDLATGKVTTLATSAERPAPDAPVPVQLTGFLTPSALAQAPDGTLLIADSEVFDGSLTLSSRTRPGLGNGVWALAPDGALRQVAGFAQPTGTPMADGTGAGAVFESITALCADAQGGFYVEDLGRVRRLTADGTVQTLADTQGQRFHGLYCGPAGQALTSTRQADGTYRLVALPSGLTLGAWDAASAPYAPASAQTAWAWAPGALFLADLESGKGLPGTRVPLNASGQLQIAGQAYTPDREALRAASGEVAYLRTTYGIVRMTYR
ncbi:hypothetical protein SAMN04489707_101020 [Paenacidovorax caeni]|uniref:Uncharacterized protein n=1 Tax=Paenacidovorax caeni TaxID=343013 RepID=A0A1I7HDS0_9BURK|nr:hypothetical protein [Paenacidovorax caeni]SFU58811.1 hypothetical protein SAMN04489707_101020 [Paenacidovorax caeni]